MSLPIGYTYTIQDPELMSSMQFMAGDMGHWFLRKMGNKHWQRLAFYLRDGHLTKSDVSRVFLWLDDVRKFDDVRIKAFLPHAVNMLRYILDGKTAQWNVLLLKEIISCQVSKSRFFTFGGKLDVRGNLIRCVLHKMTSTSMLLEWLDKVRETKTWSFGTLEALPIPAHLYPLVILHGIKECVALNDLEERLDYRKKNPWDSADDDSEEEILEYKRENITTLPDDTVCEALRDEYRLQKVCDFTNEGLLWVYGKRKNVTEVAWRLYRNAVLHKDPDIRELVLSSSYEHLRGLTDSPFVLAFLFAKRNFVWKPKAKKKDDWLLVRSDAATRRSPEQRHAPSRSIIEEVESLIESNAKRIQHNVAKIHDLNASMYLKNREASLALHIKHLEQTIRDLKIENERCRAHTRVVCDIEREKFKSLVSEMKKVMNLS